MSKLEVKVHTTTEVPNYRINHASEAINKYLEGLLDHSFNVSWGKTDVLNSGAPTDDDSELHSFFDQCEMEIESHLDDALAHIVIFHRSIDTSFETGTAGHAAWEIGKGYWEDGISNVAGPRSYYGYGQYGLSIVNAATGNFPYSDKIFRSTVIHELGHQLGAGHLSGEIVNMGGGFFGSEYNASPMATWYVEQGCANFPTGNSALNGDLCKLDQPNIVGDHQKACYHRNWIATGNCDNSDGKSAQEIMNNHISENV